MRKEMFMYTNRDYDLITRIHALEAKLSVAADSARCIDSAVKGLCEKHNIPKEELDKIRDGIFDLQSYLERK
jgi:hypothetical protein